MYKCKTMTYYAGCTAKDKTTCCFDCKDKETCGHPCLFKPSKCNFSKADEPAKKMIMVKSDESEEALMMAGRDFESRPDGAYVVAPEDVKTVLGSCPFCKSKTAPHVYTDNGIDNIEPGEDGFNEDPSYCVCCSMPAGGCGATSGYRATVHQAIAAWNRRDA